MIMENNSYDPGNYTKENTEKRQNSINMTNGNRKSNIRSSIFTTEKYLQNHIHQQRTVPGNYSYSNATQHQKRKAVVIGDSHLSRINKSRFKNDNIEHAVYFKCFSDSNTKQLNYYPNPTLVDEQPNTVIAHIGSNNITKFNYSKVDVEDLVQRIIIDVGKNASLMVSIILRYRQFCLEKNVK